jgi:hypothetical protein
MSDNNRQGKILSAKCPYCHVHTQIDDKDNMLTSCEHRANMVIECDGKGNRQVLHVWFKQRIPCVKVDLTLHSVKTEVNGND